MSSINRTLPSTTTTANAGRPARNTTITAQSSAAARRAKRPAAGRELSPQSPKYRHQFDGTCCRMDSLLRMYSLPRAACQEYGRRAALRAVADATDKSPLVASLRQSDDTEGLLTPVGPRPQARHRAGRGRRAVTRAGPRAGLP